MLTFTLDAGAPASAVINRTPLLAWRPEPWQAPSANPITVRVTDDGAPPLSSSATFTVGGGFGAQVLSSRPIRAARAM